MKKILILLFSILLLSSPSVFADDIQYCNLDTHVKFRDGNWENLDPRKFTLITKDDWIQVINLTAEQDWGNFIITKNTKEYINAFFESYDANDSWIKILAYNKVSGYTKLISVSPSGLTIHLGLCL